MGRLLAVAGWAHALALSVRLRRQRGRLADVEHELRGAATAIALALERLQPAPARGSLLQLELARMSAALAELAAARSARHGPAVAGADLDAGRLAQVLCNVIANATEHGEGEIEVNRSVAGRRMRLEIRNRNRPPQPAVPARPRKSGRGRGIPIAKRAARELGGSLRVESGEEETVTIVELPKAA
jgi:C4-dicarboxylate-specific signal transduction histidine kinase